MVLTTLSRKGLARSLKVWEYVNCVIIGDRRTMCLEHFKWRVKWRLHADRCQAFNEQAIQCTGPME
jgi:hypothetical protein